MAMALVMALAAMALLMVAVMALGDEDLQIYHSASLLSQDYQAMVEDFKIFVYPELNSTECDLRRHGSEGTTEGFFFRSLITSNFVTENPEEANLFLLPLSIACVSKRRGAKKPANAVRLYIQQVRDLYPYWQRALGADHVFLSCQGFTSDASRNVLELKKNAIQVACFPTAAGRDFFPHKDIAMPPLGASLGLDRGHRSRRRRSSILAYYSAAAELPAAVRKSWEVDTVFATHSSEVDLPDMLSASRFCVSSSRKDRSDIVLEALHHGCIPVIFTDSQSRLHDLPLQDVLNWSRFSLVLQPSDMAKLRHILQEMDDSVVDRMQAAARAASTHLQWNAVPKPLDAFHMILYQLWRRHYTSRYIDQ